MVHQLNFYFMLQIDHLPSIQPCNHNDGTILYSVSHVPIVSVEHFQRKYRNTDYEHCLLTVSDFNCDPITTWLYFYLLHSLQ